MKKIMILIGPPGSGKSTLAKQFVDQGYVYVNQDAQGKSGHLDVFKQALNNEYSIVIDRLNFSREQRKRYIPPSESGYIVECIVLHENRKTCLERMMAREDHPTINGNKVYANLKGASYTQATKNLYDAEKLKVKQQEAGSALNTFFKGYERPNLGEGFDSIDFRYPETRKKISCIVTDIDGTIANLDHRLHFIKPIDGSKKNFRKFLDACDKDLPKKDVIDMVINTYIGYGEHCNLVACSGRGDECREKTQTWLDEHLPLVSELFMRERGDYREDYIIKENLLDFEILTRYHKVYCVFDDRNQVVDMWRRRGILCLQVADGNF